MRRYLPPAGPAWQGASCVAATAVKAATMSPKSLGRFADVTFDVRCLPHVTAGTGWGYIAQPVAHLDPKRRRAHLPG